MNYDYETSVFHGGDNVADIVRRRMSEGWAVFQLWQNPTAISYPGSGSIIITWIKLLDNAKRDH